MFAAEENCSDSAVRLCHSQRAKRLASCRGVLSIDISCAHCRTLGQVISAIHLVTTLSLNEVSVVREKRSDLAMVQEDRQKKLEAHIRSSHRVASAALNSITIIC